MKRINILFTGGLDSSYTMMYFSKFPVEIQPYYLKDHRVSEGYELKAIKDIINDIRLHPDTKANIRELITRHTYEIEPDNEIQKAYRYMFRTAAFGKQYGFIARFARQEGVRDLFLSIVVGDRASEAVKVSEGLERVEEDGMEYFRLDPEKTEKNLYLLFENVLFPPSYKYTKKEEIEEIKKLGFESSIAKTWFCFWPVDGKPCGICHSCVDLMESGMTEFLTEDAMKRYEEDKKSPGWKHTLRGYRMTLADKWYEFRMRNFGGRNKGK